MGPWPVTETSGVFVSAATRSGLLFGVFAFFSSLGLGILFPLCAPLCGVVWGIGAGLAAVVWSDPANPDTVSARDGAIAGSISGVGALLGLFIGVILSFAFLGGDQMADEFAAGLSSELGYDMVPADFDSTLQWVGATTSACCLGLVNLAIMASAGAGGAAIYASRNSTRMDNQAI
jgi:hypothetical protein